jgi:hypothetical protein
MDDTTVSGMPCARESGAIARYQAGGNASGHADDHIVAAGPAAPVAGR